MELHDKPLNQTEILTKTVWICIAISLSALEMLLPRIPLLPWLKPGLANCITILWIIKYGTRDAVIFAFLRSWITSFYFGFSFITFILSISGGVFATCIMGAAWVLFGKNRILGTIGIGMIGALAHNCGQLCIIYLTMARNSFVFYQIPFMCGASLVFGCIIGMLVPFFSTLLENAATIRQPFVKISNQSHYVLSVKHSIYGSSIFAFCIAIIFFRNFTILSVSMIIVTGIVQLACGLSVKKLFYPLKFWPFFIFIAIVYLFFSFGTRVHGIPFITREGLNETVLQFLRLWIWLEASLLLTHFKFHTFFFRILITLIPSANTIFSAGLLALEYFPEIAAFSKSKESRTGLDFLRKPLPSLQIYIHRHIEKISLLMSEECSY